MDAALLRLVLSGSPFLVIFIDYNKISLYFACGFSLVPWFAIG